MARKRFLFLCEYAIVIIIPNIQPILGFSMGYELIILISFFLLANAEFI